MPRVVRPAAGPHALLHPSLQTARALAPWFAALLCFAAPAFANERASSAIRTAPVPDTCRLCACGPGGPAYVRAAEPGIRGESGFPRAAVDAVSGPRVRVAYVIPSNRTAQPDAVARIRHTLLLVQRFYRDQMQKHGHGSRTFIYETEADGVTPRVHVVNVPQTDATLRGRPNTLEQWDNVNKAAEAAGITIWAREQVWLMIPETHAQLENGDVLGNVFLGAGFESAGATGGVCMMGSNALAALQTVHFTDDRAFAGLRIPALGPYPLKTIVGGEGATLSTASTSIIGGLAHELGHAFGLAHDYRNDENFHGNLEGNGLRGMRGNLFPGRYPADYVDLSEVAARVLSVSPYFDAPRGNDTAPTVEVTSSTVVTPANGVIEIRFSARATTALALAYLVDHEGVILADMPLSGATASGTFLTSTFVPNTQNAYRVAVYDINGNRRYANASLAVGPASVRAPRPFVKVARPIALVGESVQLDASGSSDPVYAAADLRIEWDLNGDGIFDTAPSSTKTITLTPDVAGTRRIAVRVTNPASIQAVSAPAFIYAEGAILTATAAADRTTLEWLGSQGFLYRLNRSRNQVDWSDAGLAHFIGTGEKIAAVVSTDDGPAFFRLVAQRQTEPDTTLPAMAAAPRSATVTGGGGATFSAVASGPGPTSYQWQKDGVAIPGATHSSLTFHSADPKDDGSYTVTISNSAGAVTSAAVTLTVQTSRLANLSVRSTAGTGEQTLIVGFTVSGTRGKQILLRGIGPSLASFGVAGPLLDPRLRLFDGTALITENDNWGGDATMSAAFASVGAFALPPNSRDAALLVSVGTRSYSTQIVAPADSGVALVEAYDADPASASARLTNLSARNEVGTGTNVLIIGFAISGSATKKLLIRAVGPGLIPFGVARALADPQLTVFNKGSGVIAQNDDWRGEGALSGAFAQVGAFPLADTSKDAALLVTLDPGSYTAQVSGATNTTGIALVEVYELP